MAILIDAGADVDAQDSGALLDAMLGGHEHTVAFLEARGAKQLTLKCLNNALIEVCDVRRFRTYQASTQHYDPEKALDLLLDRGADVNVNDGSILLATLEHGYERRAALLESRGAKLTLEQLNHALIGLFDVSMLPRYRNPERAFDLLLDRGVDVNANDSSALLAALRYGHENLVALLEAKGAKKPTLEQLNTTLVRVCIDRYHRCPERAVELLLDRGAYVNAKDNSALLAALEHGHEHTVALLEARGANKPTLEQLKEALIEVRGDPYRRGLDSAAQMLLDRGADGNTANSETSLIE
jgi:ankyrin repeat protein